MPCVDESPYLAGMIVAVFSVSGSSNMSWHKALNLFIACGASVDAQFIVGRGGNACLAIIVQCICGVVRLL